MRRAVFVLIVVLVGCGTAGELDPAVVDDLRATAIATFDAMHLTPAERPSPRALGDQVSLLALQVDRTRLAGLENGDYGDDRLRADADALDRWVGRQRDEHGIDQHLPQMLDWLRKRPALDGHQRLLLHALIRQVERETGYQPDDR